MEGWKQSRYVCRPIPSANRSGRPSPTRVEHVLEDLGGRVELVLDGGPCPVGVESTVLDVGENPPVLLRPGGVPSEALKAVVGEVRCHQEQGDIAKRFPGTRYRHYAPRATVLLASPEEAEPLADRLLTEGRTVGVMARCPLRIRHPNLKVRVMPQGLPQYARELFATLARPGRRGMRGHHG